MRIRKLRNHQSGATAIEYGLIAGLIALGIVGSLVGTKGSLNGIFNATSSGMAQATASHPKPPASTHASYWAAKTLVSMVPSNVSSTGGTYKYTYSDNTIVTYTVGWKPDGSFNNESISIQNNPGGYNSYTDNLVVNSAGQATQISRYSYWDNSSAVYTIASASGAPTDSEWLGTVNYYQRDGSFSTRCGQGSCYAPTISQRAGLAQDPLYFRGLAAQM